MKNHSQIYIALFSSKDDTIDTDYQLSICADPCKNNSFLAIIESNFYNIQNIVSPTQHESETGNKEPI